MSSFHGTWNMGLGAWGLGLGAYGVDPQQVPDFIALRGDPSDKLPGTPGVGAITAATLLRRYGTLEKALAAGRFPAHAKQLRLFRSIATMNRKAPISALRAKLGERRCSREEVAAQSIGKTAC
jgi:5'-3' exonuclease